MLNIKDRPYGLLLFTAIVLSIAFIFIPMSHINFRDTTMFTIPLTIVAWIIPLLLISFWLLYIFTKKFLYSITITRIHVFITVATTMLIAVFLYMGIHPSQPAFSTDRQELIGNAIQILFILFVCAQCTYVANVLLRLLQKIKGSNSVPL
jgi:hypothetical protein